MKLLLNVLEKLANGALLFANPSFMIVMEIIIKAILITILVDNSSNKTSHWKGYLKKIDLNSTPNFDRMIEF